LSIWAAEILGDCIIRIRNEEDLVHLGRGDSGGFYHPYPE
jgi:hypothetical protein